MPSNTYSATASLLLTFFNKTLLFIQLISILSSSFDDWSCNEVKVTSPLHLTSSNSFTSSSLVTSVVAGHHHWSTHVVNITVGFVTVFTVESSFSFHVVLNFGITFRSLIGSLPSPSSLLS